MPAFDVEAAVGSDTYGEARVEAASKREAQEKARSLFMASRQAKYMPAEDLGIMTFTASRADEED